MAPITRPVLRLLAVALPLLLSAGSAKAQRVVVEEYIPTVSYYTPAPRVVEYRPATVSYYLPGDTIYSRSSYYPVESVSYYPAESVSYYPARSVTYYPTRSVSYYPARSVTYYPAPVTTTRYGILGRPRETTSYYPVYSVR